MGLADDGPTVVHAQRPGHADALATTLALAEFKSEDEIAKRYPDGVRDLHDRGYRHILAAQATDDSELALARTLLETGHRSQITCTD